MVVIPICPKCENTGLSVVDVDVEGHKLKGVQCNSCSEILWLFHDNTEEIKELIERVESLESDVHDLID